MDRGIIDNRDRAQQIIDFSGLRYGRCTATDIDGVIELGGEAFLFLEYKFDYAAMKTGQELCFQRIVDGLSKPAMLIVATHNHPVGQDIDAANAIVMKVWAHGRWWNGWTGHTVKEVADDFFEKNYFKFGK